MLFQDILVSLRKEEKLSQEALAEKLELSRSTIAGYEQGKRFPRKDDLENIADYFNVDMDYLLGKSDTKRKYDYSELRERYEFDDCLGKIAANGSKLDMEIIKSLPKLNDMQKEELLTHIQSIQNTQSLGRIIRMNDINTMVNDIKKEKSKSHTTFLKEQYY